MYLPLPSLPISAAGSPSPGSAEAEQGEAVQLAERLEWFRDLKFGLFLHWGAYSQWGCIESWPLVEVDEWARPDDLPPSAERQR